MPRKHAGQLPRTGSPAAQLQAAPRWPAGNKALLSMTASHRGLQGPRQRAGQLARALHRASPHQARGSQQRHAGQDVRGHAARPAAQRRRALVQAARLLHQRRRQRQLRAQLLQRPPRLALGLATGSFGFPGKPAPPAAPSCASARRAWPCRPASTANGLELMLASCLPN